MKNTRHLSPGVRSLPLPAGFGRCIWVNADTPIRHTHTGQSLTLAVWRKVVSFGAKKPSGSQYEKQQRTSGHPILSAGIKGAFFGGVSNIGIDQERPLHSPVTFRQDEFN